MDENQQINRIVRTPYPAGAVKTGLKPWTNPGKLPGVYLFPTIPGCAVPSSTISTPSGSSITANEIQCGLGTDAAVYAIINGLVRLGQKFSFSPVMTSWPNGRVDVFGLDSNSHVQQRTMVDGNLTWATDLERSRQVRRAPWPPQSVAPIT